MADSAMAPSKSRHFYSIIIPTYTERLNIAPICYLLFKHMKGYNFEMIVVDDASPDGTQDTVKELQKIYGEDRIELLMFTVSSMLLATSSLLWMLIFPIMKQLETNADIVTGTRYIKGGGVHGWDLRRKLTSRGANVLAHTLLWPRVSDLTGSIRLYKKLYLRRLSKYA